MDRTFAALSDPTRRAIVAQLSAGESLSVSELAKPFPVSLPAIMKHLDVLSDMDQRYKEFSALDERFHLLIHRASKNRFIADFYDAIAIIFHYHYQWNKAAARQRNERAIHEHLDYIAALESGDQAQIDFSARLHLRSARQTLLQSLPQNPAEA